MSHQQQKSTTPVVTEAVPWWIRLCRWLWKLTGFLGGSVILTLVINVASTWLTASKGILPDDAPLHLLVAFWPVTVSVGCCLLLLAILLWGISRWSIPGRGTPLPITPQDRTRLVNRLHSGYKQMLSQSLQGAVQIELGLASRPAAIQNAALLALHLPEQAEQALPPHASITDAYDQAQHELLILGEPGAGKSTLLLELAHHLVEHAKQDTEQPVPVLLPLSSWAINRRPLQEWIIDQFAQLYAIPRKLSMHWVRTGMILPLLDGLDEMDDSARPACITAINTYHREHLHPLVVCSRADEYDAATTHERLALQASVVVQPLSREQVDTYLTTLGKPLAALRTTLRKNPVLQELTTTPLMLNVLMLTYQGRSARSLPKMGSREAQQQQIFTNYVERMLERKGNKECYSLGQIYLWLGWLAQQMRLHNQTVLFLEQLQPDWLPKRQRLFYRGCVMLTIMLIAPLFEALVWLLIFGIPVVLLRGTLGGILQPILGTFPQGLNLGITFGLYVGLRNIRPSEVLTWSMRVTRRMNALPSILLSLTCATG